MRCLIVDDNESFLSEAGALLEREGIDIVGIARTGAEALEQIAALEPDVTLLDIDLGTESGFDLARALTDRPAASPARVILISLHRHSDYADLIDASPAVGFLSKTDLSALAIRDILRHNPGPAPEQ